jgi:drug/metabolite transporter (DMT)-like permease
MTRTRIVWIVLAATLFMTAFFPWERGIINWATWGPAAWFVYFVIVVLGLGVMFVAYYKTRLKDN